MKLFLYCALSGGLTLCDPYGFIPFCLKKAKNKLATCDLIESFIACMQRKSKYTRDHNLARRVTLAILIAVVVLYLVITFSVFSDTGSSGLPSGGGGVNSSSASSSIESVLIEGFPVNLRRKSNS